MKKLTCKDLGGPCDEVLQAETFEEMGEQSRAHVMGQVNAGDEAHKADVEKMKAASLEEQKAMMAEFEKKFEEAIEE